MRLKVKLWYKLQILSLNRKLYACQGEVKYKLLSSCYNVNSLNAFLIYLLL